MKIGVFDSGLGGLVVLRKLRELLPEYDYVFFADQAYVPYGNKTKEELTGRAQKIFTYLFEKENCEAILLACNTTSTNIYDELKEWVKENFKGKEVWGIAKPTLEAVRAQKGLAFFGTHMTISSGMYQNGVVDGVGIEMPELASMIEKGEPTIAYIESFKDQVKENTETGVLVCTHYPLSLSDFQQAFPQIKNWICQENIISKYIKNYLSEKNLGLSKEGTLKIMSSKQNPIFEKFCQNWFFETPIRSIDI